MNYISLKQIYTLIWKYQIFCHSVCAWLIFFIPSNFEYATIDYLYTIKISRVPCPVSRRVMYPGVTLVQSQVYVTWSTLLTLIGTWLFILPSWTLYNTYRHMNEEKISKEHDCSSSTSKHSTHRHTNKDKMSEVHDL